MRHSAPIGLPGSKWPQLPWWHDFCLVLGIWKMRTKDVPIKEFLESLNRRHPGDCRRRRVTGTALLLSLKDVIRRRMDRGDSVNFFLKLYLGMGVWSLVAWFPTGSRPGYPRDRHPRGPLTAPVPVESRSLAQVASLLQGPNMAYADFTLDSVELALGLTIRPGELFPNLEPLTCSGLGGGIARARREERRLGQREGPVRVHGRPDPACGQ